MNDMMYEKFKNFIYERENRRLLKVGERPKHNSILNEREQEILDLYRFTNIRRRDDKHTKFVHNMIREYLEIYNDLNVIRGILLFAVRCSVEGLNKIVELDYDLVGFIDHCIEEDKFYRQSAYIASYNKKNYKEDFTSNLSKLSTLEELKTAKYMGKFMINQYCVYLRDIKDLFGLTLADEKAMNYYAFNEFLGTGKGLEMLELPLLEDSVYLLRDNLYKDLSHIEFDDINDVSNCLCEFSKFINIQKNPGKRMRKYVQ
jgi:hypothetical protein